MSEAFVPHHPKFNHSSHTGNDPVDSGTLEEEAACQHGGDGGGPGEEGEVRSELWIFHGSGSWHRRGGGPRGPWSCLSGPATQCAPRPVRVLDSFRSSALVHCKH